MSTSPVIKDFKDSQVRDVEQVTVEKLSGERNVDNTIDPDEERRLVRRIDRRIIPLAMLDFLLSFIDRSNIGNAKILNADKGHSLVQSTNITNSQYLVALILFFVAYGVFETPSNYALNRFRPSRWIAFLMFSWGIVMMTLGSVQSFAGLATVRFLLGAFEAGLFPGTVYLLTFWYTPRERAVRIALVFACGTLGGAFGGTIAFGVGHMDGVAGLEAWRWLCILEGIPPCAFAIVNWFFLPNYPETEKWLSESERVLAVAQTRDTITDWRLYLHCAAYAFSAAPVSSISLFSPSIVAGLGYEGLEAQLWTVPPYAVAFVVTVTVAWLADRYGVCGIASGASMLIAGTAFAIEGALPPTAFKARFGLLVIAVSFSFSSVPPLLSWLTGNLRSKSATALAIPLNVTSSQLGRVIGVYIYKPSEAPVYPTGHFTNAAFSFAGSVVVGILLIMYILRNRRLALGERRWRL